ncbi:hypothetical protein [Polynucleobacter difficilis]|jgi:hypothetical protein|uniref:hypothetical protein n=1 Tax=Polynucleobacter difficilis TaxID=556054 RepID=UPI000D391790|nr:hypothetical protein [Polynucleobacter difficilis]
MPQHPRYTNSPNKNIELLYSLLNQLEGFGLIHEEIHQNLDSIMAELYPTAARKYSAYENGEEFSEDGDADDYFSIPSVSSLFEFVDSDEKEQFIQDFRNTIAYCMFSGTWNTDDAAEGIIELRDIEYYKMHTYLEEDTETKKKYEYSKKTIWFPSDINPLRTGIYEISDMDYQSPKHSGYAYWNGKKWFYSKILLKDCIDQKRTKENEKSYGSYCWRGFLEQQST